MSRKALESRLGPFVSRSQEREREDRDSVNGYTERPYVNPRGLWDQYVQDRDALRLRLARERERRKDDRDREYEELSKKYAAEAQSIRHNLFLDRFGKRLAYNRLARRRKRSFEQLKSRTSQIHTRRPTSYRYWLLQRALTGNSSARDALREMSSRLAEPVAWDLASEGRVEGESKRRTSNTRPSAVFRNGAVEINYRGVPLIDDGNRLHVTDNDLESVRALLESARQKYDSPLEIEGGAEFKASVAICALEMPEIRFADRELQQQVDLLRTRERSERESGIER